MIEEVLTGFGLFVGYYAIVASILLIIHVFLRPPKELFPKMLHIVCVMSVLVLVYAFDTWYLAMQRLRWLEKY